MYILDGAPYASKDTRAIAQAADLVVIPTGQAVDDLEPSMLLAHDLMRDGVPRERITFALCKVSDSDREVKPARAYLDQAHYTVLDGEVPFRTGFAIALDQGRAITEASFRTLTHRADRLSPIDGSRRPRQRLMLALQRPDEIHIDLRRARKPTGRDHHGRRTRAAGPAHAGEHHAHDS